MAGDAPLDLWTVEIDGVRGVWAPSDGPLTVALMFGVGFNDEPMTRRGISHLVEHLSLFGLDHRRIDYNGHTTPSLTAFTATGTAEEVQAVLDHVCRSLHQLPTDRIENERRVLRTEAQGRGRSLLGQHLFHRFGNVGAGLIDAEELGLRWLHHAELSSWIRTWFTSGNAVLAAAGPDPRVLHLDVPVGPAATRTPAPPTLITRPSIANLNSDAVALTTIGPIDPAWAMGSYLLGVVAEHRLRTVDARAYAIGETSVEVGDDQIVRFLSADCLPEEAAPVRDALSSELAKLAARGPSPEQLADAKEVMPKPFFDTRAAMAHAYRGAETLLAGRPLRTPAASLQQLLDVSAEQVATALDQASDRILWTIPYDTPVRDRRYTNVDDWSTTQIQGTAYQRGADPELLPQRAADRLVVGEAGVMVLVAGEHAITIPWQGLQAACRYTDRSWTFFGGDGFRLVVRARDWFGGGALDEWLARAVPPHLVVQMGEALSPNEPDVDPGHPAPVVGGSTDAKAKGRRGLRRS